MEFSLLLPLVNFKAVFLKTAKGSFMEIWRNHWWDETRNEVTGSHRNARPEFKPFQCAYLDYGGILSRQWEWVHKWSSSVWVATYRVLLTMPTEQSQWRPAMPPFLLSPLSIVVLLPFPRFRGWGTIWAFISISTLPLPHWISFVSECHQLFTTSGSNWFMRVFMWHMPFGQQIQWFSRISFQKSWTNVNFTKKHLALKSSLQSRPIEMRIFQRNERCRISAILGHRRKLF